RIDLSLEQRVTQAARSAQLAPVDRLDARRAHELRGHLGDDDGFGEDLRPDLHDCEEREHHRNRSSGARCAWTKRATYGSAGALDSSSNVPCCAMRPSWRERKSGV